MYIYAYTGQPVGLRFEPRTSTIHSGSANHCAAATGFSFMELNLCAPICLHVVMLKHRDNFTFELDVESHLDALLAITYVHIVHHFRNMAQLKLYSVSDSPPTLAVRLALKALDISHSLVDIDFAAGEHLTDDYAKVSKVTQSERL
jgi:glutathione S-transferase